MPNFHPHLVASVAPLLEPGEEVWAVYPAGRRSLVATRTRLFLVGPDDTITHQLDEFDRMRRPRPTLVVLERRGGGSMRIALDPLDEHGIQSLTVIGLLVAALSRPDAPVPHEPAPARSAPGPRRHLGMHRHMRPGSRHAARRERGWTGGWAHPSTKPFEHRASQILRHAYRLGPARLRPLGEGFDC